MRRQVPGRQLYSTSHRLIGQWKEKNVFMNVAGGRVKGQGGHKRPDQRPILM